jgi:hypothetical protein
MCINILAKNITGKKGFRPLKPSKRVFKLRKREDVEDVREQLRPHTWYDEDNDLIDRAQIDHTCS